MHPEILPCQRDLFDIPAGVAYLNAAYIGPQPRPVTEAGLASAARKAAPWRIGPADFFAVLESARTRFATLAGCDAGAVALIPSVSYGVGVAAANVRVGPGDEIILLAGEFPSDVYPWRARAQAEGARVVTVARPADHDWTAAVLAAIGERTAVVAVPNCHWTDGGLVDLVRVGGAARAAGAALVVDATQSFGVLPLDLTAVRPDFLVVASYKWLLGPYRTGFLVAGPAHRDGRPIEYTWLGRAGSEDFNRLADYTDAFQPGARRYDAGEGSDFVTLPMLTAALELLLAWGGPAAIGGRAGLLGRQAAAAAAALGLEVPADHLRAPHLLGLRLPGGTGPGLAGRLAAEQVHVSLRGDALRISPHVYNTPEEVDRLFGLLAGAL